MRIVTGITGLGGEFSVHAVGVLFPHGFMTFFTGRSRRFLWGILFVMLISEIPS